MILDGAEVIAISKKDDFGVIRYSDDSMPPIPVKYLAIYISISILHSNAQPIYGSTLNLVN